jgi:hypothetical protein
MSQQAVLDTPSVDAYSVATLERPRPQAIELLDGDEIIQLCIKPSHWFIAIVAARTVGMSLLFACAALWVRSAAGALADLALVAAAGAGVMRLMLASLQWASSLYVLTNRRVVRFRGVMSVQREERMLTELDDPEVTVSAPQRWLRLASIAMPCVHGRREPLRWEHLSNAAEVHEQVLVARRRARRR